MATATREPLDWKVNYKAGCEVEASEYGLSIYAGLVPGDCNDKSQLSIEVRYFHPELHYRDGRRKAQVSRRYNDSYSAHLWVDQGRPFWGQHVSLWSKGMSFCRDFTSIETLAESIVERLEMAIEARKANFERVLRGEHR